MRATAAAALALVGVIAVGCSPAAPEETGSLAVTVSNASASVQRVAATLSSASMPERTVELVSDPEGAQWSVRVEDLSAEVVTVAIEAFDGEGMLTHRGAGSVGIVAGSTASLRIIAQEVNPPPTYGNTPPRIHAIAVSATSARPGGVVHMHVQASDPDPGAVLTYAWSATGGAFADAGSAATEWVAPDEPGTYEITIAVSDELQVSATARLQVIVAADPDSGALDLSVVLNSSPEIWRIDISPSTVDAGEAALVVVRAVDPDGDALVYSWSASCAGSFADPLAAETSFVPAAIPAGGLCTLYVAVTDETGGSNSGWIGLWVGSPPLEYVEQIACGSATIEVARPQNPCGAFYTRISASPIVTLYYAYVDRAIWDYAGNPLAPMEYVEISPGPLTSAGTTVALAGPIDDICSSSRDTVVDSLLVADTSCGFIESYHWWDAPSSP